MSSLTLQLFQMSRRLILGPESYLARERFGRRFRPRMGLSDGHVPATITYFEPKDFSPKDKDTWAQVRRAIAARG